MEDSEFMFRIDHPQKDALAATYKSRCLCESFWVLLWIVAFIWRALGNIHAPMNLNLRKNIPRAKISIANISQPRASSSSSCSSSCLNSRCGFDGNEEKNSVGVMFVVTIAIAS